MDERAGGGDDADRAEYDRDLEQRFGEIEIRIPLGGVVAPGLEFLCLGEQFFLAVSGRGIGFIAVDPLAIAFDPVLDLGSRCTRAYRAAR